VPSSSASEPAGGATSRRLAQCLAWLRARAERHARLIDGALVLFGASYVLAFVLRQVDGLTDPHLLEWDSRMMMIHVFRFHGSGLFPDDLLADFSAAMCPPGWNLLYWLGTLFTEAETLTKVLPFVGLGVVVWQGYRTGARVGGRVLGIATCVLLVHCNFLWDRMIGANPRGFGFPLVIAFLRYAAAGDERRTLAALILQAAFYPSAVLFCGPAYALTVLHRWDRARFIRLAAVGLLCGVMLLIVAWNAERVVGRPIALDQLATLKQRGNSGLYPLAPANYHLERALKLSLYEPYGPEVIPSGGEPFKHGAVVWALVAVLMTLAGRRLRAIPTIFPALIVSSLGAFAVAQALAYRLYFPDRMLLYAWPLVGLLGLPWVAHLALEPRVGRHASAVAGILLCGLELLFYGSGLPNRYAMHAWGARDDKTMAFLRTLPKEVLIATSLDEGTYVQIFARRKALFSASTNVPHFYRYGLELEQRIDAWYRAYYALDLGEVRRFRDRYHVDYLIGDDRDFAADAKRRSQYIEPWSTVAAQLLGRSNPGAMALSHPPAGAVVFRDGPHWVVDAHKL
jgi:hypothetical protein